MKIKIFGCSFMAGTDLSSADLVWPSVIARDLDMQTENFAEPGIGNLRIMESVLLHADPDSINIIGWTWIDRFDVLPSATETWTTLRPVLDHKLAEHYFRYFHGQYRDMLTNLAYITAAIDHLERSNAPFLMTVMDNLLFESVRAEWHPPAAVHSMQSHVIPYVSWFDDMTFLQWARLHQFEISPTLHPLEPAHESAASIMQSQVHRLLSHFER